MEFAFESDPLRESMKQLLEQLPKNSEQVKAIFKSLLLVHISKIKDQEERSTWQSFINTLDNMSQSEQASYSFGPLSNSGYSTDFKKFLRHKKFQTDPFEVYQENLKKSLFNSLKTIRNTRLHQRSSLRQVSLISIRLKFVEAFWKWHMYTAGLDQIAAEFYEKKVKSKSFNQMKASSNVLSEWKIKLLFKVMIAWAEFTRDVFSEKKKKSLIETNKKNEVLRSKTRKDEDDTRSLNENRLGGGSGIRSYKSNNQILKYDKNFNSGKDLFRETESEKFKQSDSELRGLLNPNDGRKRDSGNNAWIRATGKNGRRSESEESFIGSEQYFNKHQQKRKIQISQKKKSHLVEMKKRFEKTSNYLLKQKILFNWIDLTKKSIFIEKLSNSIQSPIFRICFNKLRSVSPIHSLKQKYSVDHLSDYELSIKITILERKLAGLHQNLLSEQITSRGLQSERDHLYKLLS